MKNIKKFEKFVNENKENSEDLFESHEDMLAKIEAEIDSTWTEGGSESNEEDAQGEDYVVEIGLGNSDADKVE